MAFVYNAVEAVDREFLSRVEHIQQPYKEKLGLRRIDVYKSDRIACRLDYSKTPSLIFMKEGKVVENVTDLSAIEGKIAEMVAKHA